jgi:hypothetical protein
MLLCITITVRPYLPSWELYRTLILLFTAFHVVLYVPGTGTGMYPIEPVLVSNLFLVMLYSI